jgi:hypothetical protein
MKSPKYGGDMDAVIEAWTNVVESGEDQDDVSAGKGA